MISSPRPPAICAALALTCAAARAATFIIPPGQDELAATMVGRGVALPGACRLIDGSIAPSEVSGRYECEAGSVEIALLHRDAGHGVRRTAKFSIEVRAGTAPAELLDDIASRVRRSEHAFRWQATSVAKTLDEHELALPWAAAIALGCAGLLGALALRGGRAANGALLLGGLAMGLACAEIVAWRSLAADDRRERDSLHAAVEPPSSLAGVALPADLLTPPRTQAEPRTLFIGDSFTQGIGVANADNFASLVRSRARGETFNHGIAGSDTEEQLLLWSEYSNRLEPDTVVWVFVLNDLAPSIPRGPDLIQAAAPPRHRGIYLDTFLRRAIARRAVTQATIEGYRRSLATDTNPRGFRTLERALRTLRDATARRRGRLLFVIFPLLWELENYPFDAEHAAVAKLATRNDIEVLDLLPLFANQSAPDLWVSEVDHHPNQRGHEIAAEAILGWIGDAPAEAPTRHSAWPTAAEWLAAADSLRASSKAEPHQRRVALVLAAAAAVAARDEDAAPELFDRAMRIANELQQDLY